MDQKPPMPRTGRHTHRGFPARCVDCACTVLWSRRSDRVEATVTVPTGESIDGVARTHIRRNLWEKFVFLATASAVTAVTHEANIEPPE